MSSAVLEWLQGPDAERGARRELERVRLPVTLADDALQDARLRVLRTATRGGRPPTDPVAYGYRALQNAVRDLYRRGSRRVSEVPLDELLPLADLDPITIDVPDRLEDDCRRAAHGTLAVRPWVGAAVLNQLTFKLHRDVAIPRRAPRPEAGSDDQEASWAALWLAGKVDCFPRGREREDAAMRQRRARALAAVADQLQHTVEVALAGATT